MRDPIVTIPAGAQGIDYAGWRPTADQLAPWKYVVRYACKLPNAKAATPAEVQFILSTGTAFMLVWEQGAADWQQGAAKGTEHGRLAAQFAWNIAYPTGLAIIAAFDTNASPGDARAYAYGLAFADQVEAAGYTLGLYADLDVIRLLQGRSGLNWLAGATSWSDPTKPYQPETMPGYELVHVRQVISGSTPNYDRNITLRPFWAWLPHDVNVVVEVDSPVAPSTPIIPDPYDPNEDDMAGNAPLIKMDKRYNEAFLVGAGIPVWLTGEDEEALKAAGVPVADSDPHPSFEIVAKRAGCDLLTSRG